MSLTIEDLKPKKFKVAVKGVSLECEPLRLSHVLMISKIGNVFENPAEASAATIKQAEEDIDAVFGEIIPELKGLKLDMSATLELISEIMEHVQPSDNKELTDNNVKFDKDPKA